MYCTFAQCVRANDCLRRQMMARITTSGPLSIVIVNPARIPGDGADCPHFQADCIVRFALGVTHLLDNIPYSKIRPLKRELISYFKKTTYYRIQEKERRISPGEQAFIRQLFARYEINEEPRFDRYIDEYDW